MRITVARMDGTAESGFAPGALKPSAWVPVQIDFAGDVIATVPTEVEADRLVAIVEDEFGLMYAGWYPAIGGRSHNLADGVHRQFEVMVIGLSKTPNADSGIPAIAAT